MEQTLLLNATFEPLKVVHWQKAITLWCQGKVEIIASHEREVRAVSFSLRLPSVIRLLRYVRIRKRFDYVPFSRANIYARDAHTCQYCNTHHPTQDLTFDHVIPVSQGGRKDWENIVTCCVSCNRRKGGRTPGRSRHAPGAAAAPARFGAGDPHHHRPAADARTAGATTSTGTSSSTTRAAVRPVVAQRLEPGEGAIPACLPRPGRSPAHAVRWMRA